MEQLTKREADYLARFRGESHPINTQFGLEMVHKHYLIADSKVGYFCLSAKGADMLDRFYVDQGLLPPLSTDGGEAAQSIIRVTSDDIMPRGKDAETLVIEYEALIAELEANLANALEVSRIKGEALAAAIAENEEYRAALKPFAESVAIDTDLMKAKDGAGLYIRNSDGDRFVPIETSDDELHVRQLRAAAEVYAKFKGAGDE